MLSKKRYVAICTALLIMFSIAGCSSSSKSMSTANTAMKSSSAAGSTAQLGVGGNADSAQNSISSSKDTSSASTAVKGEQANSSKIVKTATIEMETLKFDIAVSSIQSKCNELGGYSESSNISGASLNASGTIQQRFATLRLRIPKNNYSTFMNSFGNLGNITNKQETGENITEQYFDTDAHVTSLKVQEARLLELLKKSGDLTSILGMEKELQNVRYQIESLTTSLKKMDNSVDYATFNLNIHEVQQVTPATANPVTLSGKIAKSFQDSVKLLADILKGILIAIVYLLPFALVIGLILLLCLLFRKLYYKYFRKNNDK